MVSLKLPINPDAEGPTFQFIRASLEMLLKIIFWKHGKGVKFLSTMTVHNKQQLEAISSKVRFAD